MPLKPMPPLIPRRPFWDDAPQEYYESDNDFFNNNREFFLWCAENEPTLRAAVDSYRAHPKGK